MKIVLLLNKSYEIDLDDPKNSDIVETLRERVSTDQDIDPDSTSEIDEAMKDEAVVHDAVRSALEYDMDEMMDLDIDENDFQITVVQGGTDADQRS